MTKVAILPVPTENGNVSYCALAGNKRSEGKTAGEALDALALRLFEDKAGTLIIGQGHDQIASSMRPSNNNWPN